jgi:ABC-type transport system involved in cytochrome c biogenesis ATPase subunit
VITGMLDVSNLCCIRGERALFSGIGFHLDGGELL